MLYVADVKTESIFWSILVDQDQEQEEDQDQEQERDQDQEQDQEQEVGRVTRKQRSSWCNRLTPPAED